ncbi:MAG: NADH-quinone oxidoreductase subunit J [Acidimicrobiales bacterium]
MVAWIVFALAALICLGGGAGVVLAKNPVHSALSLVATLFGVAVLFVSLDAEFLAAVQVIVYAGAIVVMFLFVIMLLASTAPSTPRPIRSRASAGGIVAGVALAAGLIGSSPSAPSPGLPRPTAPCRTTCPTSSSSPGCCSPTTCGRSRSPRCCS